MVASCVVNLLITKPTRVTKISSSVIDHILTNNSSHYIALGIVMNDITDHYPVFCYINGLPNKITKRNTIYYRRDKSNFNVELYSEDLF